MGCDSVAARRVPPDSVRPATYIGTMGGTDDGTFTDDHDLERTEPAADSSSGSKHGGVLTIIALVAMAAAAVFTVGVAHFLDVYAPTTSADGSVTSRDKQTSRCKTSNGSYRDCTSYIVSGRIGVDGRWSVDSFRVYDRFSRGDRVTIEQSVLTNRVVGLDDGEGTTWRASLDWFDRLVNGAMALTGAFGMWVTYTMKGAGRRTSTWRWMWAGASLISCVVSILVLRSF